MTPTDGSATPVTTSPPWPAVAAAMAVLAEWAARAGAAWSDLVVIGLVLAGAPALTSSSAVRQRLAGTRAAPRALGLVAALAAAWGLHVLAARLADPAAFGAGAAALFCGMVALALGLTLVRPIAPAAVAPPAEDRAPPPRALAMEPRVWREACDVLRRAGALENAFGKPLGQVEHWVSRRIGLEPARLTPEVLRAARKQAAVHALLSSRVPSADEMRGIALRFRDHDYELVRMLGKGAQGVVYLLEASRPSDSIGAPPKTLAIKVLHPRRPPGVDLDASLGRDRGAAERALRELSLWIKASAWPSSRLPFIARVLDLHLDPDGAGISGVVTEHYPGGSLDRRLPEFRAPAAAEHLMTQIALALHAMDRRMGLSHRDLKPANILLDSRGNAALTDFGLSSLAAAGADGSAAVGTRPYMAPEAFGAHRVIDPPAAPDLVRADVYSFGAVFYELLTGRRPVLVESRDLGDWARAHAASDPAALPFPEEVPEALRAIVRRCLQPDPERRYRGFEEVLSDLPALWADAAPKEGASITPESFTIGLGRGLCDAPFTRLPVSVHVLPTVLTVPTKVGRLAGALLAIGEPDEALDVVDTMMASVRSKSAGLAAPCGLLPFVAAAAWALMGSSKAIRATETRFPALSAEPGVKTQRRAFVLYYEAMRTGDAGKLCDALEEALPAEVGPGTPGPAAWHRFLGLGVAVAYLLVRAGVAREGIIASSMIGTLRKLHELHGSAPARADDDEAAHTWAEVHAEWAWRLPHIEAAIGEAVDARRLVVGERTQETVWCGDFLQGRYSMDAALDIALTLEAAFVTGQLAAVERHRPEPNAARCARLTADGLAYSAGSPVALALCLRALRWMRKERLPRAQAARLAPAVAREAELEARLRAFARPGADPVASLDQLERGDTAPPRVAR